MSVGFYYIDNREKHVRALGKGVDTNSKCIHRVNLTAKVIGMHLNENLKNNRYTGLLFHSINLLMYATFRFHMFPLEKMEIKITILQNLCI